MKMNRSRRRSALLSAVPLALIMMTPAVAHAADLAVTSGADAETGAGSDIAEGSDILVTATQANELAPVTASLRATQPQAIISRSFIEDSLPATADFNGIALISPSVSNYGGTNGAGLSESKAQIRGFQDGEYNVTYDGVPFGDTNDPTHHSNTFFPSNTVETLVVDRGPGNASQLGQATFGGNINMFSRETRDQMGGELKGTYGTYDTYLLRGVLQSGAIDALGGSEFMLSAQHIKSDGARSYSPFKANNVFGKAMIPIGPDVKLTILGTYNENSFNQPDKDGATPSQVAAFGKNFSLNNDPTSQTYFSYNHTHKTTDFEIVKLEANLSPHASLDNRAYTYSYDNETLSGSDVTLYATATPAAIAAANKVSLSSPVLFAPPATAALVNGVPGYTKTNKYRVYGDIAKAHFDMGFGTLTVGAWIEHSDTYRQQRDVNLVTGDRNYAEKKVTNAAGATLPTPADIKFDQNSQINHAEEFVEFELRPLEGLKITPGFKHVDFNRKISALINQTTRIPQGLSANYTANLPFATINYAVTDKLAVYAQYARGFLMPPLADLYVANPGLSTVEPERSTNYQAGAVYHGEHISIDADAYYIKFKNKFAQVNSGTSLAAFINQGAVNYKGLEGQITYAFPRGIALFANASRNYAKTDNPGTAHLQVGNAPVMTAAGGLLYKHGPISASLIDKYTGAQYVDAAAGATSAQLLAPVTVVGAQYRIPGYNTANLSLSYDFGIVRVGLEVTDMFDSTRVTNINAGKTAPFDQYFFQPGRAFTGDITVKF
jgi:iron complex outermembrane receptor protein